VTGGLLDAIDAARYANPAFVLFWSARTVSFTGTGITSVVLPVLVYGLTGSAAAVVSSLVISATRVIPITAKNRYAASTSGPGRQADASRPSTSSARPPRQARTTPARFINPVLRIAVSAGQYAKQIGASPVSRRGTAAKYLKQPPPSPPSR
jgi:hypothetical protein